MPGLSPLSESGVSIQEPAFVEPITAPWLWRCLACGLASFAWVADGWQCDKYGERKFYNAQSPTRRETVDGTWVFTPHGFDDPQPFEQLSEKPVGRRRRRRPKKDDPPGTGDGWERAESEIPTDDPVIDPSAWHGEPPHRHRLQHGKPASHTHRHTAPLNICWGLNHGETEKGFGKRWWWALGRP